MPYATIKLPRKGHVKVVNSLTGRLVAKDTTPEKAAAQQRLLYAIHDPNYRLPRRK